MKVLKEDSLNIEELLREKQKAGHAWLVYRGDVDYLKQEDLHFFKSKKDALAFQSKKKPIVSDIILLSAISKSVTDKLKRIADLNSSDILIPSEIKIPFDILRDLFTTKTWSRERAEDISTKIQSWGAPHDLAVVFENLGVNDSLVALEVSCKFGKDKFDSTLFINADKKGFYQIEAFTSTLKRHIEIPALTIGGIDCRKLDKDMGEYYAGFSDSLVSLLKMTNEQKSKLGEAAIRFCASLDKISISQEGNKVAEKLMAKYWLDTPMEGLIDNPEELHQQYIVVQNFDPLGKTFFTQREAYNLMAERYVSKEIAENNQMVQPWFYRHSQSGASASNIIRITASETLDIDKHVDKLIESNIDLGRTREEFIKMIRRGDEPNIDKINDEYKQVFRVYFNPFLNEMEMTKVGAKVKINQSKDLGNDLGKGKQI